MESNKSVYYSFKFFPFLIGLLPLSYGIFIYLYPQKFVNEEGVLPDIWNAAIPCLFGVLLILLGMLINQKIVTVEMNNQTLKIKKGSNVIKVTWLDVESVRVIPTVFPPLYKLRLRNYGDYFLFNTTRSGFNLVVFIWDWSDMGQLIRDKKERFGI